MSFFKEKIKYLGHKVSSKGVWPSRDNLKAITKYPEPTTYTAIKGFVGVVRHYRHFIKNFARIADPLYEYMHGETAKKKKKERVVLSEAARYAFQQLKKAVMSSPVLAYPDPSKNICLRQMPRSLGWVLCYPRSSQTGGIIPLHLEVGHCMEQRSTTIAPSLS